MVSLIYDDGANSASPSSIRSVTGYNSIFGYFFSRTPFSVMDTYVPVFINNAAGTPFRLHCQKEFPLANFTASGFSFSVHV